MHVSLKRRINERRLRLLGGRLQMYVDPADLWVGAYLDERTLYWLPLPCCVVRWSGPRFTAVAVMFFLAVVPPAVLPLPVGLVVLAVWMAPAVGVLVHQLVAERNRL